MNQINTNFGNPDSFINRLIQYAENGNISALNRLGRYCLLKQKYKESVIYYTMAIDHGDKNAINIIEKHYIDTYDNNALMLLYKKYDKTVKLIQLIECNLKKTNNIDKEFLINIITETDFHDHKLSIGLSILKKSLHDSLDTYDLHFKYNVNGLGYDNAKDDFIKRISL